MWSSLDTTKYEARRPVYRKQVAKSTSQGVPASKTQKHHGDIQQQFSTDWQTLHILMQANVTDVTRSVVCVYILIYVSFQATANLDISIDKT